MNAYNQQLKAMHNKEFRVVEVETNKPVGDGKLMPYAFAKYVRDVRDTFNSGAFVLVEA